MCREAPYFATACHPEPRYPHYANPRPFAAVAIHVLAVGGIVAGGYLAYLISMIAAGDWFGDGRRSSATAFNALVGLIVFGYPGFMYAMFGRFTWKPEPDLEDYTDELTELDEMDTGAGG